MPKPIREKNYIWRVFSSVKLTLAVLIILAVTSIFGTVFPQQEAAMEFAKRLSPGLFQVFVSLQLFDMYHSVWFRAIIGCLALNLVVCSLDRLPSTLRRFRAKPSPDRSGPFERSSTLSSFLVQGTIDGVASRAADLLEAQYKRIDVKNTSKGDFFYGQRGRYSYFGVYIVHLSVLLILIGGVMGSLFGLEAYVNIVEGETVDKVRLSKNRGFKTLGFDVRCEKFTVEFYDTGSPKEYRSDLVFLSGGQVLEKGSLLVNHPITFRGITFYQANYGITPGNKVILKISKEQPFVENATVEAELGKPVSLPGNEGHFVVADIRQDFMRLGPAVRIFIRPVEGNEIHFWVFQRQEMIKKRMPGMFDKFPALNPAIYKPYIFSLANIRSKYYTGLQVARNPGVPLVWVGCFMMVVGFLVTFFVSHRQVWVRISEQGENVSVSVAGRANKNPFGLERELEGLTNRLRELLIAKRPEK